MNASGYQAGVESAETGVNCATFVIRYFPEFRRALLNIYGQTTGWALPSIPSGEVTVTGEVSGGTGLMAATFYAAQTFANDTAGFGRSAGAFLMTEVTETQDREGWRSVSMSFRADPILTAV